MLLAWLPRAHPTPFSLPRGISEVSAQDLRNTCELVSWDGPLSVTLHLFCKRGGAPIPNKSLQDVVEHRTFRIVAPTAPGTYVFENQGRRVGRAPVV